MCVSSAQSSNVSNVRTIKVAGVTLVTLVSLSYLRWRGVTQGGFGGGLLFFFGDFGDFGVSIVAVLVLFISPIGASGVDPGCIEFKPGDQPFHNTLLREGPLP